MANKPKPPKKSNTNHNHNKSRIKLVLVAVVMIALSLGAVFTAKQYFAYKSLDKKIDQVSTLLEQNGISDITKKDECSAIKIGTPVHCSISLESTKNENKKDINTEFETIVSLLSNQTIVSNKNKVSSDTKMGDPSSRTSKYIHLVYDECIAYIGIQKELSESQHIIVRFNCGYKAWWKQIL